MTVHLISVGLSVLDSLGEPSGKFSGNSEVAGAIRQKRPHLLLADAGIDDTQPRALADDWMSAALSPGSAGVLRSVAEAVRVTEWPRDISAEVETFDRAARGGIPLRKDDIAILICSDTPRGLLAGLWNAVRLTAADFGRIRYLPAPDSPPPDSLRGSAVQVRVPGMDAGTSEGFRRAMGGLGVLARNLFESGQLVRAEEFRFYLSGGFKAAIPYLIGMAEAVRSMDRTRLMGLGVPDLMPERGPYPVRAFVLHETAGPQGKAIPLPLRMLIADAIRAELTGFGASRKHTGIPGYGTLNGYAYETTGRPGKEVCELTAFGDGLRALFGVADA